MMEGDGTFHILVSSLEENRHVVHVRFFLEYVRREMQKELEEKGFLLYFTKGFFRGQEEKRSLLGCAAVQSVVNIFADFALK